MFYIFFYDYLVMCLNFFFTLRNYDKENKQEKKKKKKKGGGRVVVLFFLSLPHVLEFFFNLYE